MAKTGLFLYAFSSQDTARSTTVSTRSQLVVDNLQRFGTTVFFMGCGSPPPLGVVEMQCPAKLATRADCFVLRTEEIRLAMMDEASAHGIGDAIFLELDQLWLTDPRVPFSAAVLQKADVALTYRGGRGALATGLNLGFAYTRTRGPARNFWSRVVVQSRRYFEKNVNACIGGANQGVAMSLLGTVGYKLNLVTNETRVHIGKYWDYVREPWLVRSSHHDLMLRSISRSGTATPCLATLLMGQATNWGKLPGDGTEGPPSVLHYKGWPHCPSQAAADRSFSGAAICIRTAVAAAGSNLTIASPPNITLTRANSQSTIECGMT